VSKLLIVQVIDFFVTVHYKQSYECCQVQDDGSIRIQAAHPRFWNSHQAME
jgi:hypothetical protein